MDNWSLSFPFAPQATQIHPKIYRSNFVIWRSVRDFAWLWITWSRIVLRINEWQNLNGLPLYPCCLSHWRNTRGLNLRPTRIHTNLLLLKSYDTIYSISPNEVSLRWAIYCELRLVFRNALLSHYFQKFQRWLMGILRGFLQVRHVSPSTWTNYRHA